MAKIAVGADHGGYELKAFLMERLIQEGYEVIDCGVHAAESADYPDIAAETCKHVLSGNAQFGLVMCGTGIGISISANKIRGIRAALCADTYSARMAREHNDANVIALGGRTVGPELAWDIVQSYLGHTFTGGRHARRVAKIMELEEKGS